MARRATSTDAWSRLLGSSSIGYRTGVSALCATVCRPGRALSVMAFPDGFRPGLEGRFPCWGRSFQDWTQGSYGA